MLGCDTIVVLDGVIYGKPADAAAARATLAALGGRTHEVLSGLALLLATAQSAIVERTAVARTRVTFRALDGELLDWYVATEEWRGRSGGYAIQGEGAALALEIDGEVENVVGLPLETLLRSVRSCSGGARELRMLRRSRRGSRYVFRLHNPMASCEREGSSLDCARVRPDGAPAADARDRAAPGRI